MNIDDQNTIICEAIDAAAVAVGIAREGHSPTHGICRFSDRLDVFDAQDLTETCWEYIVRDLSIYDGDDLRGAAYNAAYAYLTEMLKNQF